MDYNKLLVCPKYKSPYDNLLHILRILSNCHHTICSKCISQLNNNSLVCSIDKNNKRKKFKQISN